MSIQDCTEGHPSSCGCLGTWEPKKKTGCLAPNLPNHGLNIQRLFEWHLGFGDLSFSHKFGNAGMTGFEDYDNDTGTEQDL